MNEWSQKERKLPVKFKMQIQGKWRHREVKWGYKGNKKKMDERKNEEKIYCQTNKRKIKKAIKK